MFVATRIYKKIVLREAAISSIVIMQLTACIFSKYNLPE